MIALTLWIVFSLVVAFMGHNNANAQEAPPCYEPNLLCGYRCIKQKYICDDIRDCDDGEDESNCQTKCQPDEFSCEDSSGLCIPIKYKCNGNSDCDNDADELGCPDFPKQCRAGEFACGDGSCMPNRYYCDGHPQCSDHSDEKECATCADLDWFQCEDGACVTSALRCDNYYDCRDFSDGQNCFIESEPTPRPSPRPLGVQPTITVQISSPQLTISEVVGSQVRFNCSATSIASNNVHIQWSKVDEHLPDRAIDDRSGLLVITDLKISDSGHYVCSADDGVSVVTKYVNLAVVGNKEEPPRVQIQPSFLEVNVSDPIDLHCQARGIPEPTLQWAKVNRDPLNLRHTFTNGIFRVENAVKGDEGEYECTARNSAGIETARTIVYVKDVPGISVRPIISPEYYTGTSGESFTLSCKAGPGQQRIYWTKQHGHLPYNSQDENGILIVTDARTEDSGNYICTVQDYEGRHGNATANVNIISGDIGVYPSVNIEPTTQKVSQGSNVVIHCNVSGSPTPQVKWTKLNDPWPTNVNPTDPVLKLYNVQISDRGVYICVANNNLGLAQSSSVLEIERREAPIIEIHPNSSQTVTSGGNALMQCRIKAGIPQPTLSWHRPNGQPLSQRIEQLTNGLLKLMGISEAEAGEYICTAENEAGRVTAVGNIIVQTQPVVVINPMRETLSVQPGEFVRLECRATGSPTPTVQWSKYKSDSQHAYASEVSLSGEDKNVAVYEINYVSQDDEGVYTCLGRNDAGATEGRIMLHVDNSDNIPSRGSITDPSNTTISTMMMKMMKIL